MFATCQHLHFHREVGFSLEHFVEDGSTMNGISTRPIRSRKSKDRSAMSSTFPRRRFFQATELAVTGEVVIQALNRNPQRRLAS